MSLFGDELSNAWQLDQWRAGGGRVQWIARLDERPGGRFAPGEYIVMRATLTVPKPRPRNSVVVLRPLVRGRIGIMQHVFISYKNEDLDFAENVISRLEKAGFTTWADSKIGAGEEWRAVIDLAVKNALALVVIMTPEAKASEYVTYEWAFAWGGGIKVIPIMLRKTELHPRLEALQYLDFTSPKIRPWGRLIEEVRAAFNAPLTYSVSIPLNSPPFIRQAVASLDSANFDDRAGAIKTLQMARTPAAYTVLREALKHPLLDVRAAAAASLIDISDPATVAALTEALKDPDDGVRLAAAGSLAGVDDPTVVAALTEALRDSSKEVRLAAVRSLGGLKRISDLAAMQVMIDMIDMIDNSDVDVSTYSTAIAGLRNVKPPAIPFLIKALKNSVSGMARYTVSSALEDIRDPAAVPFLMEALRDSDGDVRSAAARALGNIGNPAAVAALTEALRDSDEGMRSAAASGLGLVSDPAAVAALTEALRDSDEGMRSAAAQALGDTGNPASVEALIDTLRDSAKDVRLAAIDGLERFGNKRPFLRQVNDPAAVAALTEALKDSDRDVRISAQTALRKITNSSS